MIAGGETMAGRVHPCLPVDCRDPDRMPCVTGKLESVETQHAAIAVSKRVDPVQLVDVMAKSVEKILGAETPKLVMGGKILEGGRQAVRDIGRVNKQAPALLNIHRAILPRPFVEVLEQMLVNGAIAFGIERKGHARGLTSARMTEQPFGLRQTGVIGQSETIPECAGIGMEIGIGGGSHRRQAVGPLAPRASMAATSCEAREGGRASSSIMSNKAASLAASGMASIARFARDSESSSCHCSTSPGVPRMKSIILICALIISTSK